MKIKKLLIAVIAMSILSLPVIFSGCALTKQQKAKDFLESKLHNWRVISKKDPKEFYKYYKICSEINPATVKNINLIKNCTEITQIRSQWVAPPMPPSNLDLYK